MTDKAYQHAQQVLASRSPLKPHDVQLLNAYWRAANYLTVGQIYLLGNPLLRIPCLKEHCKPRLLGHWGTSPGLNLLYVHLNRVIKERDVDVIFVAGPGHGGPAVVANVYLEGTYSEYYPNVCQSESGMANLFKQFSFPGGIPSHVSPDTPGSIHEGGELGMSLAHAYGAVFDNPGLIAACVVGDGEAETGPLAAAWHSNKLLNPAKDGAVLPILALNGFKIANPTILARIGNEELTSLLEGYGHAPIFVDGEGDDATETHHKLAAALNLAFDIIAQIQQAARSDPQANHPARPTWPMVVLRTPKGWTGPKEFAGLPVEGTWRSHQVPFSEVREKPENLALLISWLQSYRPQELFDESGKLIPELAGLCPLGKKRMGDNPSANPGVIRALVLPPFADYAIKLKDGLHGSVEAESTRVMGSFLSSVTQMNPHNFRVFGESCVHLSTCPPVHLSSCSPVLLFSWL